MVDVENDILLLFSAILYGSLCSTVIVAVNLSPFNQLILLNHLHEFVLLQIVVINPIFFVLACGSGSTGNRKMQVGHDLYYFPAQGSLAGP